MCRRVLAVLALAAAHALMTAHPAPAASFYGTWPACQNGGHPIESQAWWHPLAGAPEPGASGHVHLGVCFPLNGTLGGPAPVDAVIQLHNNPSTLVAVRWADESGERQSSPQSFSCATDHCQLTVPLTVDPALMSNAGWREIRFTADTRTLDRQRMFQTTRWCVNVANGKPVSDYCGPAEPGRNGAAGWYTGMEYTNVWIDDATFPYQAVSGTWCFRARFEGDRGFASVDPAFHAHPPNNGTVLYDDAGLDVWRSICLDTTPLADGVHTLHLRTDVAATAPASTGTASGVYSIKFTVANASSPPPARPDGDGDGVPDSFDACPNGPGPASNNGCPTDTTPPTAAGQFAAGTVSDTTTRCVPDGDHGRDPSGRAPGRAQRPAPHERDPRDLLQVHRSGVCAEVCVRGARVRHDRHLRIGGAGRRARQRGRDAVRGVASAACLPRAETVRASADAYVASDAASANFGAARLLRLDGSPVRRAYMRFTVRAAAPRTAKLRIFSETSSSSGIRIARVTGAARASWRESRITYANALRPGATIASNPRVRAGWNEISIPVSRLDASGSWTFVIGRRSSTRVELQSKENANRPRIVLAY